MAVILVIDQQHEFCKPDFDLPAGNAQQDTQRILAFAIEHGLLWKPAPLFFTHSIFHPSMWVNPDA